MLTMLTKAQRHLRPTKTHRAMEAADTTVRAFEGDVQSWKVDIDDGRMFFSWTNGEILEGGLRNENCRH